LDGHRANPDLFGWPRHKTLHLLHYAYLHGNRMTWEDALEIIVARTKHGPYREKCAASHPEHEIWRQRMISTATAETPRPTSFPPLATQAGNLVGAIGRTIGAALTGQSVRVPPEERDKRWAQCMTCVNLVNDRCRLCGCNSMVKIELAQERCPMEPPRWLKYEEPK
jgi:hypothetical protein